MKRTVSLFLVFTFISFLASPLFSEDKAVDFQAEIAKQEAYSRDAADTFWTGFIVAAVGAAVLVPVSFLLGNKEGNETKVIYIAGGGVGLASLICIAWGGTAWLVAGNEIEKLKKKENGIMLVPYLDPLAKGGAVYGLGFNFTL